MTAKPIRVLELHYPMIQFFIKGGYDYDNSNDDDDNNDNNGDDDGKY